MSRVDCSGFSSFNGVEGSFSTPPRGECGVSTPGGGVVGSEGCLDLDRLGLLERPGLKRPGLGGVLGPL